MKNSALKVKNKLLNRDITEKFIIRNESDLQDTEALSYILSVLTEGKLSESRYGKQYPYICTFRTGYIISCAKRKSGTQTFILRKEKSKV